MRCLCGIILSCLLITTSARADEKPVLDILINGSSEIHRHFADSLSEQIAIDTKLAVNIRIIDILDSSAESVDTSSGLAVSVGTQATAWAMNNIVHRPLLATLIPERSYTELVKQQPEEIQQQVHSAIFIDQPLQRQLRLLKLIFPNSSHVGAIFSTEDDSTRLSRLLHIQSQSLEKEIITSDVNLISQLEKLLNRSDVFLALPEPALFNRRTLTGILLTTYRYRVPVIGFSNAYVRAGALAAAYSSAEQIARHTAEQINSYFTDAVLPAPSHPRYFEIAINKQVARSLGINLPASDELRERVMQLEQDQP